MEWRDFTLYLLLVCGCVLFCNDCVEVVKFVTYGIVDIFEATTAKTDKKKSLAECRKVCLLPNFTEANIFLLVRQGRKGIRSKFH